MAKLNKNIISPVAKHNHGFVFHAAGQDFKMTGNVVESFNNSSNEFKTLVNALNLFTINESGIEFYYDFNSKSKVSKINENATSNYDVLLELTNKLEFLNEAKVLESKKGSNKAVTELKKEIKLVESNIDEIKRGPLAIHFRYNANENKFFANTTEILSENITEHAFAAGQIRYEDKPLFETFNFAGKNFESYKVLEFITESIDNNVKMLTMRADNNIFVCRINEATKLVKFQKMLADAAIEYVAEETGSDITFMVEDILESFKERRAEKNAKIQTMFEMIAFLKDQKGRLDEADRNIPEIKAADTLLNSEITRIQEEINNLQSESILNRSDGYVTATINSKTEGLNKDTEIKVDALEYTSAAKDDILTVFAGDEPMRIEKFKIALPAEELA